MQLLSTQCTRSFERKIFQVYYLKVSVCYFAHKDLYLCNILNITMRRGKLLPREKRILSSLGENIKLARLRRKLSAKMVAERANISRTTLWNLEKGETNSSLTSMLQVLSVLGLENDLLVVASNDLLGRKLQDAKLITKKRAPKKGKLP